GQAAVLAISELRRPNTAIDGIAIRSVVLLVLRERLFGAHIAGRGQAPALRELVNIVTANVILGNHFAEGLTGDGHDVGMELPGAFQLAEDGGNATRARTVLDVIFIRSRRELADTRHPTRQTVDIRH